MIYQQFSVSLAVSILFSGFLALTFTPALCATLLKPIPEGHHEKRGFGAFNRGFARVTERYSLLNSKLVARAGRFMLVYAGLVAMLGYFYLRLPEAFVPAEDPATWWSTCNCRLVLRACAPMPPARSSSASSSPARRWLRCS